MSSTSNGHNSSSNASLVHNASSNLTDGQSNLSLNCPSNGTKASSGNSSVSSSSTAKGANVTSVNLNGATVIRVNPYINNKTCVAVTCHGSPSLNKAGQNDHRVTSTTRLEVSNEVTQFTKLKNLLPFLLSQPSESISLETFFQLLPFGTSAVNSYVFKFHSYGINNLHQLLNQVTGEKVNQISFNPNASLISICIGHEGHRQLLYNALDFFRGIQQENKQVTTTSTSSTTDERIIPPPLPKKSMTMGDISSQLDSCHSNEHVANICSNVQTSQSSNNNNNNNSSSNGTFFTPLSTGSSTFYCDVESYSGQGQEKGGKECSLTAQPMDIDANESTCVTIESSGHIEQQQHQQSNNNGNRFLSIRNRKLNFPSNGQIRYQTAKSAPSTPAGEVSSDDLTAWFRRFSFFSPG